MKTNLLINKKLKVKIQTIRTRNKNKMIIDKYKKLITKGYVWKLQTIIYYILNKYDKMINDLLEMELG